MIQKKSAETEGLKGRAESIQEGDEKGKEGEVEIRDEHLA